MKTFKIKIFDHADVSDKQWEKSMLKVQKYLKSYGNVWLVWSIEHRPKGSPTFDPKAIVNVNGKKGWRVDKKWFTSNFTKNSAGFDFCMAYYSDIQWLKPYRRNCYRGQSIDQYGTVSEIAMCGSHIRNDTRELSPDIRESQFVSRTLHEMCHGIFDHKVYKEDVTHEYHYDKKDLLIAFKRWGYFEVPISNRDRLYNRAVSCIGIDASPNDLAPDELGCAETVNAIHRKEFGFDIGGSLSTYNMYQALKASKEFIKADQPMPGDVVISPTGYGSGALPNGHVGIVGKDGKIMSNDSYKGTFEENYTLTTWYNRYVVKGGYPMDYYRRV